MQFTRGPSLTIHAHRLELTVLAHATTLVVHLSGIVDAIEHLLHSIVEPYCQNLLNLVAVSCRADSTACLTKEVDP